MDAYDISLPKWPAMLVVGQPVTPDQAFEIIVKTDPYLPDFQYATNAHSVAREYSKIFGVDEFEEKRLNPPGKPYNPAYYHATDDLKKRLGVIPLEYVNNTRILSSYIGGPKGWVSWDGVVGCSGFNIGKYPSVQTVHEEWTAIAAAFPYLDLTCWLFNGESCEEGIRPVVKFVVKGGKADVLATSEAPVTPNGNSMIHTFAASLVLPSEFREVGIQKYPFTEGLKKLYGGKIPQLELKVDSSCERVN